MKIKTKAEADRDTLTMISSTEKQIRELEELRDRFDPGPRRGRERRDIDEQIAQLRRAVVQFRRSVT